MGLKQTANKYYKKVHSLTSLRSAWKKVYNNGIRSLSSETRAEVKEFAKNADSKVEKIYRQLLHRKFKFFRAKGVLLPRPGKEPRPIVKYPIQNSIVQRRILDILQTDKGIQKYFLTETSFGGIKGKRVKDAVKAVHDSMKDGHIYFIRSDIKNFFADIPKEKVLKTISAVMRDSEIINLLERAVNAELENLTVLGNNKDFFPTHEIGVAQGCCLSPLMGNIVLNEFDEEMNSNDCVCLRYIDDFIILGKSESEVKVSFKIAQAHLKTLGLTAYDPFKYPLKSEFGKAEKGTDFLGCKIQRGSITPAKKSRKRIIEKVDEILKEGIKKLPHVDSSTHRRWSFIGILDNVSNTLRGWGNQYSFCNNTKVIKQLDKVIDEKLIKFFKEYSKIREKLAKDPANIRRLVGVHLLIDSKYDPIID